MRIIMSHQMESPYQEHDGFYDRKNPTFGDRLIIVE